MIVACVVVDRDLSIGFDPHLGPAGQRLVGGVDHGAWTVDIDPVALDVALAGFYCQYRQVGAFAISADVVLIDVDALDHYSSPKLFIFSSFLWT